MKHLKFILPLFLILFACSPDSDDTAEDTRLQLTVLDENEVALENIEVQLYATQADYDNDTNIISTSTTDATGKVTFENLQPITYFWKITADCYLENAVYNTVNPIVDNTLNLFSTNLTSVSLSYITIVNNTPYNYDITFLLGGITNDIPVSSNSNFVIVGLPFDTYVFNLTPTEGPNQNQTTQQTLTLNCGVNAVLEIN